MARTPAIPGGGHSTTPCWSASSYLGSDRWREDRSGLLPHHFPDADGRLVGLERALHLPDQSATEQSRPAFTTILLVVRAQIRSLAWRREAGGAKADPP